MSLSTTRIAEGPGWQVTDVLCGAGPGERPLEERHDSVCVAVVVAGTFQYRTAQGDAILTPGALMLGNAGACFECGHEHGVGDRCVSFQFDPSWFVEVVASIRGVHRTEFSVPRLPASEALAPLVAAAETVGADPLAMEEIALQVAGTAILSQDGASVAPASAADQRRASEAVRLIEAESDDPITLAGLARTVAMSPYHFLRTFRAVVGMTPYQFILGLRLRRAAARLRRTEDSISDIAFAAGFGDLSTFNRRFRRVMGVTPSAWRRG